MTGGHDEKRIAEKYALDYPRRPWATRRWKGRWNWLALVVTILVSGAIYLWRGETAFWAGSLSDHHASFAEDCARCHREAWGPALRLAMLDSGRHSVPDAACQTCHAAGDHHPRTGESLPACATCHQEHRPSQQLTAVADSQCVSCHGDLNSVPGAEIHFATPIDRFSTGPGEHPEFAILRGGENPPGNSHRVWQVASRANPSAGAKWVDSGGLFFNHKLHLASEGVLNSQRENVKLMCADCHVPDAAGSYMRPLEYEQHCASCHPLRLGGVLDKLGDLPHDEPDLVRGALRDRLAVLASTKNLDGTVPMIPRLPRPAMESSVRANEINRRLAEADHAIFGLEAKGLCRKCHHVVPRESRWEVLRANPEFSDSGEDDLGTHRAMLPDRWLYHGKFHHERHATVACAECHAAAESSLTADILLPGIETCRKCHGVSQSSPAGGVSSDCVLCHDYHGPSGTPHPGLDLEQLFSQLREGE